MHKYDTKYDTSHPLLWVIMTAFLIGLLLKWTIADWFFHWSNTHEHPFL